MAKAGTALKALAEELRVGQKGGTTLYVDSILARLDKAKSNELRGLLEDRTYSATTITKVIERAFGDKVSEGAVANWRRRYVAH